MTDDTVSWSWWIPAQTAHQLIFNIVLRQFNSTGAPLSSRIVGRTEAILPYLIDGTMEEM